ncbi:hypothetical protein D9M70_649860 [compost metagenome]
MGATVLLKPVGPGLPRDHDNSSYIASRGKARRRTAAPTRAVSAHRQAYAADHQDDGCAFQQVRAALAPDEGVQQGEQGFKHDQLAA